MDKIIITIFKEDKKKLEKIGEYKGRRMLDNEIEEKNSIMVSR